MLPFLLAGAALGIGEGIAEYISGQNAEEERRARFNEYLLFNERERQKTLKEGSRRIGEFFTRRISAAAAGGTRRAKALGATNTESFTAAGEETVATEGRKAVGDFEQSTNLKFAEDKLKAGRDFADRPIEPGAADLVGGILGAGSHVLTSIGVQDALKAPNPLSGDSSEGATSGAGMFASKEGNNSIAGASPITLGSKSSGLNDEPLRDMKRRNPEIFGIKREEAFQDITSQNENKFNSYSRSSFSPFRLGKAG